MTLENIPWLMLKSFSQSSTDTNQCIQQGMVCSSSRDIKNPANTYLFKIDIRSTIEKGVEYVQRKQ